MPLTQVDINQVVNVPAAPVDAQQQIAADVPAGPVDTQQDPASSQVGLDALATGIVQGNNAPPQEAAASVPQDAAAPVQELGGENSLAASGWSRKTQETGIQGIRIPG